MATSSADSNEIPELEQKIISLAQEKPSGLSNKDIQDELPNVQPAATAQVINKLIKKGYVDMSIKNHS